jgi:Elongation factor Tu GTP binding domain
MDDESRRQVYEALAKEDTRVHMNVVFIGHVDAGKSTLGGQILVLMGGVDDRTIEKYQKEAKDNNRETWYMAYVMDTNDEERAKGKTVEVGRAHFQTDSRRRGRRSLPPVCTSSACTCVRHARAETLIERLIVPVLAAPSVPHSQEISNRLQHYTSLCT